MQIPRDERLCYNFVKKKKLTQWQRMKNMFYCIILGMSHVKKNYLPSLMYYNTTLICIKTMF